MIRPQFLTIYSRDRHEHETATDFTVTLRRAVDSVQSVTLFNLVLPNTQFNITEANNRIPIMESSSFVGEIPPGAYNIRSFAAAIGATLSSSGFGTVYKCKYNTTAFALTITAEDINQAPVQFMLNWQNADRTAHYEMGFDKVNTTMDDHHSSTRPYHLAFPYSCFISSATLGDNFEVSERSSARTTAKSFIVNLGAVGGLAGVGDLASDSSRQTISYGDRNGRLLNTIDVALRDIDGNVLKGPINDWEMTLMIKYKKL